MQTNRHCFIPVPPVLKSQNISPEPLCKGFLVNKKWAEMEGVDWGMIFCPSDTLMQIRGRRDGFSFLASVLILHATIQLEDGSCSAAWKLEFYWSRRIQSVNINIYKHWFKTLALLRMEQCKEKSLPISDWLCLKMKNHFKHPPVPPGSNSHPAGAQEQAGRVINFQ